MGSEQRGEAAPTFLRISLHRWSARVVVFVFSVVVFCCGSLRFRIRSHVRGCNGKVLCVGMCMCMCVRTWVVGGGGTREGRRGGHVSVRRVDVAV